MGFPRKLKQMATFINGTSYAGEATSVTLPKLGRKFEAYRGGSMDSPVKVDQGGVDDLDVEHSYGGPIRAIIRQHGLTSMSGAQIRWVGVYENDDTGELTTVEVVIRGRHEEIDRGEQKPGEGGEFKVKSACAYYKEIWDGVTEVEVDPLNMVLIVGGVDRMAEKRAALGLA